MKRAIVPILILLFASSLFAAELPIELSDIHGNSHKPLSASGRQGVVLFFVSPFCPTSNAFVPEINRIVADYTDKFAFYLIEADADIKIVDAKKHAETLGIKAPLLLDPEQRLVRLTKAKITPEAVVLGVGGNTLYQGRINDLYVTQTKKLKEPSTHDLRTALDAVAAGKPVSPSNTKAIGCSITLAP